MSIDPTAPREYDVPLGFDLEEKHNLARLPWRLAQRAPDQAAFETYVDGAWQPISAAEHLASVTAVAQGLIAAGVQAGDRVALMAATRYEWVLLDSAVWAVGAATVPIYPSSAPAQVEWIVRDSGARLVLVETTAMRETCREANLADDVEILVITDDAVGELRRRGESVDLADVESRRDAVTLDDAASIIYTSGTTGRPKGCVISHRNLASEAQGVLSAPIGAAAAGAGRRSLMFLPLAHVLARAVTYAASEGGSTIGFWSDFGTIVDKFASFKPDLILGVPRVFEKVYDGVRAKATSSGKAKAAIFLRAESVAVQWSRATDAAERGGPGPGRLIKAQHALYDRLVYSSVRDALGGGVEYAISGGGALSETLTHFFRGFGIPVYEGYGLTESCAAITVNQPGASRVGSVGRPIGGNAVRIGEDGEILLRGGVVFAEYWRNPQATEDAFVDGWMRTGDLGALDADGYLTITGRQKDIIITAGGKNVAPGPLEESLRLHPVIGHAIVIGEGRPYISALITLDPDGVQAWAAERERDHDAEALCQDEELRAEVQQAVEAASTMVSRAEGIKSFVLLPRDFSEEGGELTPTLKVRRHVVEKMYDQQIQALYTR